MCLQSSNKLHNNVLRHEKLDPFYQKIVIGSAKDYVQIPCAQLI